jgi:hypothetical protein
MSKTLHWTFSIDRSVKGTYRRRIADIGKALSEFGATRLPANSPAQFVAYYFGCEKLAKGIDGIAREVSTKNSFEDSDMNLQRIMEARGKLCLPNIDDDELALLFDVQPKTNKFPNVARTIRDRIFHDSGPTNVGHAAKHAAKLLPIMRKFLSSEPHVQKYLAELSKTRKIDTPPPEAHG